jgi:hypothetical protein
MEYISDVDVYHNIDLNHLWIYDKLILSKKLGYLCGPSGIPVPTDAWYIVRPITNIHMMGKGAYRAFLTPTSCNIPDGYFWCEMFEGRHFSIDYFWGVQHLTVEGIKRTDRLDRFYKWTKIDFNFTLPDCLKEVAVVNKWLNIEMIDGNIIEAHMRFNDDFRNHNGSEIFPVWKDDPSFVVPGAEWYESKAADRLGFWVMS